MGNYKGRTTLIQCKDYKNTIGIEEVWKFESSSRLYIKGSFSILVASKKSHAYKNNKGFSLDSITWAENSKLDILLTNIHNLNNDIIGYHFKNLIEDEEIKVIKETLTELKKTLAKLKEKNSTVDKKIKKIYVDSTFYFKIIILLLLMILLLLIKCFMF